MQYINAPISAAPPFFTLEKGAMPIWAHTHPCAGKIEGAGAGSDEPACRIGNNPLPGNTATPLEIATANT